jgi:hypothetical protein
MSKTSLPFSRPETNIDTFSTPSSLPGPPEGPVSFREKKPPEPPPTRKKRRHLSPIYYVSGVVILLCLGLWALMLARNSLFPASASQRATRTAAAQRYADCQSLIEQAMRIAGNDCDLTGPNTVCYGNLTLQAQLVPGSQERFRDRGDVIAVSILESLSASPLVLEREDWGIAIFNIMANLPRSLPGELIKMVVFGNTAVDNPNHDMTTFYFSSQLGQTVCEQIPYDGIMISMPKGMGIHITINGTDLTLSGTSASLRAAANQAMQINIYEGSARVAVGDQEQYVGAGQSVQVPLGGDNGVSPTGGPSAPVPLSQDDLDVVCSLSGQYCTSDEIQPVSPEQAQADIQVALGTPSPTIGSSPTASRTPSRTPTPIRTFVPFSPPSATTTEPAPTASRTATATSTPSATATPTLTASRTATATSTPSATDTPSPTASRTATATSSPSATSTPTPTASHTATATSSPSATDTPTPTASHTPTDTRTDTPTPSYTPSNTSTVASSHSPAWYNASWLYRKKLTLDYTQVSGTADLSSFPVLVSYTDASLKTTANGGHVANANGYDIIFTASDGTTKLDHEIETYTAASGAIVMWVRIPTLSYTVDTDIYVYYGNSSIGTSQENKTSVWDGNYQGVWHLKESSGNFADSTSNGNTGTRNISAPGKTGVIGSGQRFDGMDDYISAPYMIDPLATNFTWSGWVNFQTLPVDMGAGETLASQENGAGTGRLWIRGQGADNLLASSFWGDSTFTFSAAGTWYYVCLVETGPNVFAWYADDQPAGTSLGIVESATGNHRFGINMDGTSPFHGNLDEVRLSNMARSAGWIATEYNNQANQGTGAGKFIKTLGSEEPY